MNGTNRPLTQLFAEFCRELKFDDLPSEVVHAAKDHLLDALGVGLASSSMSFAAPLKEAVDTLGAGEESTVLGFSEKLPAPSAALLNGTFIHSLEYDDTHIASVIHGSSVVIPTAMAIAEKEDVSGRDLIRAIVIGWELLIRLGLGAPGRFQANGFQTTAVCGPFAAAAISSTLLTLDVDKTVNAMGIAGSQSSGVFEFLSNGSTVKALHPGWAAHAGIIASYLARGGMTGPTTILEGRFGLYSTYARTDSIEETLRKYFTELGETWYLREVALKAFPCCHYIHSFLECLQNLMEDGLTAYQVHSIQCYVPIEEAPIICEPWERRLHPSSGYESKFSLPYCLASLLLDGEVNVTTFDRTSIKEEVLPIARKITYTPLSGTEFPKRFPGYLEVNLTSGEKRNASVPDVKGSPHRPLSAEGIRHKFINNSQRKLKSETIERVIEEVYRLDEATNLKLLFKALRSII